MYSTAVFSLYFLTFMLSDVSLTRNISKVINVEKYQETSSFLAGKEGLLKWLLMGRKGPFLEQERHICF